MKKMTVFCIGLLLFSQDMNACEICGCGVGNFYMGLLPNFKTKFIGFRYGFLNYRSVMASDKTQYSNDSYQTMEIWSGWNIGKRWQVLGFVPYHMNRKQSDDGITEINGMGDISLIANYQLLHSRKNNQRNQTIEQQLWLGGGVKLPTGKYSINLADSSTNIGDVNAQTGTGSTNFLMNTMYSLQINQWGWNTSLTYQLNTKNRDQYQFGNRFTLNSIGFYRFRVAGMGISPNLGVLYEHSAVNQLARIKQDLTGGFVWNASMGVECNFNKIAIGINAQLPVKQQFAEGQTRSQFRGLVHVSLAL